MRVGLHESNPEWARWYEVEAARIREVLGERVLTIEHVGSTSVPDLVAKPVIDVVLGVADSAAEDSYLPDLESVGYTLRLREPDWYEHRLLNGPGVDINLHVFTDGSEEIERTIRFRDRLREDSAARKRYETVKRDLAGRDWVTVQAYADAKSEVVTEILSERT